MTRGSVSDLPSLGGTPILATMKIANGWKAVLVGDTQRNVHFDWIRTANFTGAAFREFTAHEVRAAFLGIDSDDEAIAFFDKYGPFQGKTTAPIVPGARYEPNDFALSRLPKYQGVLRTGLLLKPSQWIKPKKIDFSDPEAARRGLMEVAILDLHRPPTMTIPLTDPPYLFAETGNVHAAISTSVYLDKIAGLKYGRCEQCKKIFRHESGHARRFCDTVCGGRARKATFNAKERKHGKA